MTIKHYTNNEWNFLPHIVLTSDAKWYPSALDNPGEVDYAIWYNTQSFLPESSTSSTFNEYGELCNEILTY